MNRHARQQMHAYTQLQLVLSLMFPPNLSPIELGPLLRLLVFELLPVAAVVVHLLPPLTRLIHSWQCC